MLTKSYRSLQSYIYFIMKLHLRTLNVQQNILSLFVLFIGVIRRTDTWQINDVTQFDVSCWSNMTHKNCLLTYSFEQSPSWYSKRISASQKFPTYYRTRRFNNAGNVSASVSILSQLDPVHTPKSHFVNIHFNIILPSPTRSPKWSHSFSFPHQNLV